MEDNSLLSPIPEMSHCRLAACHYGFESTGLAANDTKIRSLGKKGITNPVGENSDHKWGLLRETQRVHRWYATEPRQREHGRGHRQELASRFALPPSDRNGWWKEFGTYDQLKSENRIAKEIMGSMASADAELKRPGVSLQKGTNETDTIPVGLGIRADSILGINHSRTKCSKWEEKQFWEIDIGRVHHEAKKK